MRIPCALLLFALFAAPADPARAQQDAGADSLRTPPASASDSLRLAPEAGADSSRLAPAAPSGSSRVTTAAGADSLGLPGDNLDLYAVLDAFRSSPTLEEFERRLNSRDEHLNNLDLDGDGHVDYIRVIDEVHDSLHTIILRVPLGEREAQDVAMIQVGRDETGELRVQIIGDEDLYGPGYILEPGPAGGTPNPAYQPPAGTAAVTTPDTVVVVREWPVVQYLYVPTYVPWVSPWYWGYWPSYWTPWEPWYWHFYIGWHWHHHHGHHDPYHHPHHPAFPHLHARYYGEMRVVSPAVETRIRAGGYRTTYTRPELRRAGIVRYRTLHPESVRPAARPGTTRIGTTTIRRASPATRPAPTTVTRPKPTSPGGVQGTRPAPKPGVSRPAPASKPTQPAAKPPATKTAKPPATKTAKPPAKSVPARPAPPPTPQTPDKH